MDAGVGGIMLVRSKFGVDGALYCSVVGGRCGDAAAAGTSCMTFPVLLVVRGCSGGLPVATAGCSVVGF